MDIFYLGKKAIKDKYYLQIYFCGAIKFVSISKEYYEACNLNVGERLDFNVFDFTCYNKGYDTIVNLKVK